MMTMLKTLLTLTFLVANAAMTQAADHAWRRVSLRLAYGADDIDIARKFLLRNANEVENYVLDGTVIHRDIWIGRADFDDEDVDEIVLMTVQRRYCGPAGCTMFIFKPAADKWTVMCNGAGFRNDFFLVDRVDASGRRSFRSRKVQYWLDHKTEFGVVNCLDRTTLKVMGSPPPPTFRKPFPHPPRPR
jgi:hypothetical protein